MLMITARDNDCAKSLLPDEMTSATNGNIVQVNAQGISKGTSVMEIAEILGIPLTNIGVAGNDNNDRCLLDVASLGERIVVGDYGRTLSGLLLPEHARQLIYLASPEELGEYLQT
jgi:hypothetical protein